MSDFLKMGDYLLILIYPALFLILIALLKDLYLMRKRSRGETTAEEEEYLIEQDVKTAVLLIPLVVFVIKFITVLKLTKDFINKKVNRE